MKRIKTFVDFRTNMINEQTSDKFRGLETVFREFYLQPTNGRLYENLFSSFNAMILYLYGNFKNEAS